jgi:hypothetical protein
MSWFIKLADGPAFGNGSVEDGSGRIIGKRSKPFCSQSYN